MNEYNWSEISKHNNIKSCWIVANNNVYDVTEFINQHPAGSKCILKNAGKDCTTDFKFHSNNAQFKIWNKFKIGKVKRYKKKENCNLCIIL